MTKKSGRKSKRTQQKSTAKVRKASVLRQPRAKNGLKNVKKAAIAFRSDLALAHAAPLFADLHERIQAFVLDDLKNYEDPPFDLTKPIPDPIFKEQVLEILLGKLRKDFTKDSSWGVDPDKFQLTAKQLINLTKGKSLSYFIQIIYQRAHDALR